MARNWGTLSRTHLSRVSVCNNSQTSLINKLAKIRKNRKFQIYIALKVLRDELRGESIKEEAFPEYRHTWEHDVGQKNQRNNLT